MSEDQNNNQLNIELSEEVAEGTYSNLAIITHSSSEFILDFIRIMPGVPKAKVKSRVIVSPPHAKRLLRALADNIERFESPPSVSYEHVFFTDPSSVPSDTLDRLRAGVDYSTIGEAGRSIGENRRCVNFIEETST